MLRYSEENSKLKSNAPASKTLEKTSLLTLFKAYEFVPYNQKYHFIYEQSKIELTFEYKNEVRSRSRVTT